MTKFLIIRFSSIGDIIQCMSIVSGIRRQFPDAVIHWITRKDMAQILATDGRIDKILPFDKHEGFKGLMKIAFELRKENYDYIYDAHNNIRSHILKLILAPLPLCAPKVVTRSKERWKRFLLFNCGINRFDNPFRGIVSYRKPLKKLDITDFVDDYSDWNFPSEIVNKYEHFITNKCVTLVPSANWEMKRWPVSYWQRLIELLPDYRFIILAGPSDTFCEGIAAVDPKRVDNLAGRTSLLDSCYLVLRSRVVVSGDTGFMHAADLFRVPTLALIGPTAFGYPTGNTVEVIERSMCCRPCTKDGRGKCKDAVYQRCMVDITPEMVAQKIRVIENH